ncbi:MAG: metal ABC transporter permease [Bacteroidales bacterium]|nr:metal ABC transporter permease [Bacteroidales bacterium]
METLIFLGPPIAISILLSVILGYFGNHILSRGIIFIDIAVAQIAALGTMIGLLLGFAEESFGLQFASYGFTIVIIGVFAFTKFANQKIPQEAYVGIIYCIGLGMALLLAERIVGGSNFISKTITGNILWTTWTDVLFSFLLFSAIGLLHFFFQKPFRAISKDPNHGDSLKQTRLYDMLFYMTFGIVIVKAVPVGGVFLIFILLIAPAASITLFTQNWRKRLIGSWIIGIAGSVLGIFLSYSLNISNGPAIVCLLGILAIALTLFVIVKKSPVEKA